MDRSPSNSSPTRVVLNESMPGHTCPENSQAILPSIACVAYIDLGNFATNIQGGSAFGYNLLWIIVPANLMAMLLQTMSAKLGLATGQNLAELCRQEFRKPVVYAMWIVSEIMAMSTDLAEFLGASIDEHARFGDLFVIVSLFLRVSRPTKKRQERACSFSPGSGWLDRLIVACYHISNY